MGWLRRLSAFALAVAVTAVLGTAASTHFVLRGLAGLDVQLPLATRLLTYAQDVAGMAPTLAIVVAVGFGIAFPLAALAARRLPSWRLVGFPLAGAAALVAALLLMEATLGMMPVGGARTAAGLAAQGVAGAVGGCLFALAAGRREAAGRD